MGVSNRRPGGNDKLSIYDLSDHIVRNGVKVLVSRLLFCQLHHFCLLLRMSTLQPHSRFAQ